MVDKNDYGVHPRYQILNLIPVSSKSLYLIIKGLFNNDIEGQALILEGQSPCIYTEAPTKM